MTRSVLLIEPYLAGSHRAWAEGWAGRSRHRVDVLGLEGRHWRWRMTGGAVTLAALAADHVALHGPPDAVVASDMVDLAAWRGLTAAWSATVPHVLVLHEDQLTQPVSPNGVGAGGREAWTNWTSALAADAVWVNSDWHRRSFLAALDHLVTAVPDHDHRALLPAVADRCEVRPLGADLVDLAAASAAGPDRTAAAGVPPLVVWNHRWDHDKGVDRFLRSARTLAAEGVAFRVVLAGEDRHHDPGRFDDAVAGLGDRVVHRGPLDPAGYRRALVEADVVVAAPDQENFGLAVVEAVAAGCVPVVPDALAFPETVPDPRFRHPDGRLTTALRSVLVDLPAWRELARPLRDHVVSRYDWSVIAPADDDAVDALAGRRPAAVVP